jgi:hypothetical protein
MGAELLEGDFFIGQIGLAGKGFGHGVSWFGWDRCEWGLKKL